MILRGKSLPFLPSILYYRLKGLPKSHARLLLVMTELVWFSTIFRLNLGENWGGGANLIITMFFFHAKRRLHDKIIAYNSLEFGFSSLYRFILLVYLFFIRLLFWSDSRILFWTLFYIFDTISIDFILNNIQTIFYYIVNSILITLLLIHQLLPAFILTC